jgi:glycosyltransferase involved in cell wall biosynthesis
MRIVFFTFYYPPDLCAGSFRAVALAKALSSKIDANDDIHIITTQPNRYANHRVDAETLEVGGKITVHRIAVPGHKSGMLSQARTFAVYAVSAYRLCRVINPSFLIGTTSRLMSGVLTGISANRLSLPYFIDLRDIFSEIISDLFSRKSWLLGLLVKGIFSSIEKRLLTRAVGVNVVSEGFPEYFESIGVNTAIWSFFPNGVDKEFVGLGEQQSGAKNSTYSQRKTILYAGNIGSGQGLETVVPELAKRLGDSFQFVIIGDGGTAEQLREAIKKVQVNNVEMILPVSRGELLKYYKQADVLFLHLNDMPAFKRVLPSKIFEYAALGKPIVAGLSGYSAQFMRDHFSFASLFPPGDVQSGVEAVKSAAETVVNPSVVEEFVTQYSRVYIMEKMAGHLVEHIVPQDG